MVGHRRRRRIGALFAYAHESKVTADQAGDDQESEKNKSGGAKRLITLARLFPSGAFLDEFQLEQSR